MQKKLGNRFRAGYACVNLDTPGVYRTCRQSNLTLEKWQELIGSNLETLREMVRYNKKHQLTLYRISSDLIPFGSADVLEFDWAEHFKDQFDELKKLLKGIRFSMHPGQYTVLNSPDGGVVERSIRDLEYHVKVLRLLGATSENKLVLHIGGIYGDKEAAISRFIRTAEGLSPQILDHLIIENDERLFHIEDLLAISSKTGIPVIFDNLHHQINPPPNHHTMAHWVERAGETWRDRDGRPIIHYSEQAPGKRTGAHSDSVSIDGFLQFIATLPEPIDIMLEVKDKNRSAEKVRMVLEGDIRLGETIWARSKYSVLAKSQPIYQAIRRLLKEKGESDFLQIARLLEEAASLPSSTGDAVNAAEHVWGYFKDKATENERRAFLALITQMHQGILTEYSIRQYLKKMLKKYPHDYLNESYYFNDPLLEKK